MGLAKAVFVLGKPVWGLPKARQGLAKAKKALADPRPPYAGTAGPDSQHIVGQGERGKARVVAAFQGLAADSKRRAGAGHGRSRVLVERQLLAVRAKAAAWEWILPPSGDYIPQD